ncbi:hypothetical protein DY000_02054511 [Brassica cretica]|uniref:HSF-type DNA-binding domain-containing protein n=1 Tax=Brassica cretica TaxID=69181 RepID=A0ABQ7ADE8_BRACR|nr:hypothetical protein DY000_02054511 [Brassica cretica]
MIFFQQQPEANTGMSDDAPAPVRLRRPRAQGRSHSGSNSHASASSQEQNSVPIAPIQALVPAAQPEPGVMSVELLVQQTGRHHLPILHPLPEGDTTWFNKSHNGISKSINQMMYSMLKTGYKTYSKVPAADRELWFRQFANPLIRDVIDLVESQKQEYLASQPLSDDGSSASTSLSRVRVNEMVEEAVPKKKGRLVGLARRASSCLSSSQTPYVDPMIMEELQKKDDRIVALESQNATILAQMAQQHAQIAEHKAEVAEAKRMNLDIMEKMRRLFPAEFSD